jgi:hypothetical protein
MKRIFLISIITFVVGFSVSGVVSLLIHVYADEPRTPATMQAFRVHE